MKKISRSSKLRITNVGDGKLMTISNGNKLGICVSLVVREVIKVRGEVIGGSGVRNLGSLVRFRCKGGSHGSELCWRVPSLIRIIHALIAVKSGVPRLVADLAGRMSILICIPRLGAW
jgi:hypothetical protein